MMNSETTLTKLIETIREGRNVQQTWKVLLERLGPLISKRIKAQVYNQWDVEELESEVFRTFSLKVEDPSYVFKGGKIEGWLVNTCDNKIGDYIEKSKRKKNAPALDIDLFENDFFHDDDSSGRPSGVSRVHYERLAHLVIGYLADEEERRILMLQVFGGFSYSEIAEKLGKSERSVGTSRYRAVKKLRKLFDGITLSEFIERLERGETDILKITRERGDK